MAKYSNTAKINIPMCIAAVLFCLTLFSMHLTGGLYAAYTTSSSGGDSARVIKFGNLTLTEEGDFYEANKLLIVPGMDLTKRVRVKFDGSEAATYVFVEITPEKWATTDNIKFSFSMNGKDLMQWSIEDEWKFLQSDKGAYIYYRELSPNTELDGVDVISDKGTITVSSKITLSEIKSMTGISIKIRASVVQSGGFKSPSAAWASIAAKAG